MYLCVYRGQGGRYGKIEPAMNTNDSVLPVNPPKLISTLVRGFNTVAGRVHLILIPVLVDLFLWLGPKLRIHDLFIPLLQDLTATMLQLMPDEMLEAVNTTTVTYTEFLEQFNLFSAIRTFPVGVPSLMARLTTIASPLNLAGIYETPSFRAAIAILGGLLMVGFFLGTMYFDSISRFSLEETGKFSWRHLFSEYAQSLLFFLIVVALVLAASIPIFLLLSIFSLLSAGLAQFILFMMIFMVMWMVLPLVFSAHGIFALDQKVVPSMLLSVRMVRFFLPGTSLFIMVCILINEGLNTLWALPGGESWLTLMGIGGHAFIVTALLSASFLYYRDGLKWMQFNIQKMEEASQKQESGGISVE